jgi:uncharacterized Zn finger protein
MSTIQCVHCGKESERIGYVRPTMQLCPHCGYVVATGELPRIALVDAFTSGYIQAALWSSTETEVDEQGNEGETYNLDDRFSPQDIAGEALAAIVVDCARFQSENAADLETIPDYKGKPDSYGRDS